MLERGSLIPDCSYFIFHDPWMNTLRGSLNMMNYVLNRVMMPADDPLWLLGVFYHMNNIAMLSLFTLSGRASDHSSSQQYSPSLLSSIP